MGESFSISMITTFCWCRCIIIQTVHFRSNYQLKKITLTEGKHVLCTKFEINKNAHTRKENLNHL